MFNFVLENGTSISSQLVIILDTNPVWWGQTTGHIEGQGVSKHMNLHLIF